MKARFTACLAIALLLGAGPALAQRLPEPPVATPTADGASRDSGLALELRLSTGLALVGGNSSFPVTLSQLQGGVLLGYKTGRVLVGVGLDLLRLASGSSGLPGGSSGSSAVSTLLVSPGVRIVMARSSDQRVELFGQLDLGFGTTFYETSGASQSTQSNYRIVYTAGPGLRFWAVPQFAVSLMVGAQGDYRNLHEGGSYSPTQTSWYTSVVGSVALLGVF